MTKLKVRQRLGEGQPFPPYHYCLAGNCRIPILLKLPPKAEDENEDELKTRVSGRTLTNVRPETRWGWVQ
jgi:hypothetical protein